MPEPDPLRIMTFGTPTEFGEWLSLNHATERELWVKIYKKNTGIQSISWNELVLELLCWGWIDGIKKSFDDQSYLQRITPRKERSIWSKKNTEHVAQLLRDKRMQEAGLIHVRAAKADGRWDKAYVASEIEVPADFLAALDHEPRAKRFFETLNKSSRYVIAFGLNSAKKQETRAKRFEKFLTMLAHGEKPK